MKTVIQLSLLLFVLSVHGDQICNIELPGFHICEDSGVLTAITQTGSDEELSMPRRKNTTIAPKAFKDLKIEKLALEFRPGDKSDRSTFHTLNVGPESFVGLSNLKVLLVQGANINPEGNLLAPLQKLEQLILKNCDIDEVPTEEMAATPNLDVLSLQQNVISEIKPNAFAVLKQLNYLDLSHNQIRSLELGCFNGLGGLMTLDLSLNKLKTVPAVFSGLDKLQNLDISYCSELDEIEPNALKGMPALRELYLRFNDLSTLQSGVFDDVPKVEFFKLAGNRIDKIPKDLFTKVTSLKELNLAGNNIKTMEPGAFSGLNLRELNFAENEAMGVIEPGVFSDMNIENLYLNNCGITSIKPRALSGLNSTSIDLSGNEITEIGTEDLAGLSTRFLNLSGNKIKDIQPNAMKDSQIKTLMIDDKPVLIVDKEELGLSESMEVVVKKVRGI